MKLSKIRFNNKGVTEWTVGKLMSIVLLVVFLALVIYGISVGAMTPLIAKAGGLFDSAMISLGLKNPNVVSDSLSVDVPGVGKGKMTVNEQECKIDLDGGLGSYRLNVDNNHLEKWELIYISQQQGATDLSFRFSPVLMVWEWSPNNVSWIKVPQVTTSDGKSPVQMNINIIKGLEGKSLSDGLKFFWSAPKKLGMQKNSWIDVNDDMPSDTSKLSKDFADRVIILNKIKLYLQSRC
jgi:hypothetical protein